ncbi:MAG: hypothetical protein HQM10_01755 [Candidatus Riflebacteria bacterium]|nr:hypothetical protein [Candidatus Riflebacteria bacterium]
MKATLYRLYSWGLEKDCTRREFFLITTYISLAIIFSLGIGILIQTRYLKNEFLKNLESLNELHRHNLQTALTDMDTDDSVIKTLLKNAQNYEYTGNIASAGNELKLAADIAKVFTIYKSSQDYLIHYKTITEKLKESAQWIKKAYNSVQAGEHDLEIVRDRLWNYQTEEEKNELPKSFSLAKKRDELIFSIRKASREIEKLKKSTAKSEFIDKELSSLELSLKVNLTRKKMIELESLKTQEKIDLNMISSMSAAIEKFAENKEFTPEEKSFFEKISSEYSYPLDNPTIGRNICNLLLMKSEYLGSFKNADAETIESILKKAILPEILCEYAEKSIQLADEIKKLEANYSKTEIEKFNLLLTEKPLNKDSYIKFLEISTKKDKTPDDLTNSESFRNNVLSLKPPKFQYFFHYMKIFDFNLLPISQDPGENEFLQAARRKLSQFENDTEIQSPNILFACLLGFPRVNGKKIENAVFSAATAERDYYNFELDTEMLIGNKAMQQVIEQGKSQVMMDVIKNESYRGVEYNSVLVPIKEKDGEVSGLMALDIEGMKTREFISKVSTIYICMGLMILLVTTQASLFSARKNTEPLELLTKIVKSIDNRDFSLASLSTSEKSEADELLHRSDQFGELTREIALGAEERKFSAQQIDLRVSEEARIVSKQKLTSGMNPFTCDTVEILPKLKKCSVFFIDIRGFSSISSEFFYRDETGLCRWQESVFEAMTDVVTKYEGTTDKFSGDSIMVYFNAPRSISAPARKALLCSLEMTAAVEKNNERMKQTKEWHEIARKGIASSKYLKKLNVNNKELLNSPEVYFEIEQLMKNVSEEEILNSNIYNVKIGTGIAYHYVMAANTGGKKRCEYTLTGKAVIDAKRVSDWIFDTSNKSEKQDRIFKHLFEADAITKTGKIAGVLCTRDLIDAIKFEYKIEELKDIYDELKSKDQQNISSIAREKIEAEFNKLLQKSPESISEEMKSKHIQKHTEAMVKKLEDEFDKKFLKDTIEKQRNEFKNRCDLNSEKFEESNFIKYFHKKFHEDFELITVPEFAENGFFEHEFKGSGIIECCFINHRKTGKA